MSRGCFSIVFALMIMTLTFQYCKVQAQINTEKFRKYDLEEGFLFNLQTTLTIKSGNTEYTAIKGGGRIDLTGHAIDYFLVGNIEAKTADNERIQNLGFIHTRAMWSFVEKATWEGFVQRQYDEFVDLKYRNLYGTAVKYRFFEAKSLKDTTSILDLNISTGVMYEQEKYNLEPTNVRKNVWRSTNFISFDWSKHKRLSFTGVIYYQPAYNNFNDFRVAAETTLEFSIVKKVFFTFQFSYKYNNLPVTNVKPYDLSLENGLRFVLP